MSKKTLKLTLPWALAAGAVGATRRIDEPDPRD
jgi:hypothetical protein